MSQVNDQSSGVRRRDFLRAGVVTVAALGSGNSFAAPSVTPRTQQDAKYRVGVIGCGRKGSTWARAYALNPRTEIVAAADIDPENLALFCQRFKVKGYASHREMFKNERIDIAAPILPVAVNPKIVLDCAEANVKAITSEKPMAVSLEEADRMVEACRARKIWFGAGDMYRNFSQLWKARAMIEAGELGEVQSINLYQSTNEISGGGCQGLSVMRMFARDADVEWVTGWVTGDPTSDEDQGAGGYVRFANGIEGFIHCKPSAKQGIEVLCARGVFFSDWFSFHLWKTAAGKTDRWADLKEVEGLFPDSGIGDGSRDAEGWRINRRNQESVQAIVDSLEKGIEPRSSGDNGRKVLEIAIALRESHRRGFAPVRLPLSDRTLKIVPHKSRLQNKKDVVGKDEYKKQIDNVVTPKP